MLSFFLGLGRLAGAINRSRRDPEFRALSTLLILLLVIGTVFYAAVEEWSALDALYFSAATLSTVGHGDLAPSTSSGKTFTIIYLVTGVGVFVGIVSKIAATLIRQPLPHAAREADGASAGPEQRRAEP